jgi:cephalosporin hydroxylase
MSSPIDLFRLECASEVDKMSHNSELLDLTRSWINSANKAKYSYHFEWMGRPIIQYPQDVLAIQEVMWQTKPDLVIETGIAHGGSLVLTSSILALFDLFDREAGIEISNPRKVIGVDIDIRAHNREAIERHPLSSRIVLLEGSSTDDEIINQIKDLSSGYNKVMVILDSNHTHEHVLKELDIYSNFVTSGCYIIVFDTIVEFLEANSFEDRPWGVGNNPWTAVQKFLSVNKDFEVDSLIQNKLQITVAPDGFLRKI